MTTDCLVCREHALDVPVPGGHLIADDTAVAFHLPPAPTAADVFLGYLMVTSRRHVPDFSDLTDDEAGRIGIAIACLSRALKQLGAERVYVAVVGHGVAHLHVHLIPRWPGTPVEISWTEVDQWEGARRGSFADASAIVEEIRALSRP